jgi:hypothetical protein
MEQFKDRWRGEYEVPTSRLEVEGKIAAGSSFYFQLDQWFVVEPTCLFNFVRCAYLPFGKYNRYPKAWQIINRLSESEFYQF